MDAGIATRLKAKQNNPLERYREYGFYQLADTGEGLGLRESREELHTMGRDNGSDVIEIDEIVIESVLVNDYVADYLLADADEPLAKWWWHLGKIRQKQFPVELLPVVPSA